jgi:uncharacterized delta-60 repeat protein
MLRLARRLLVLGVLPTALLIALLAPAAGAAPLVLKPPAGTPVSGERLAVEPDGSTLLLTPTEDGRRFLTRLLPDGALDPSWGTGGWLSAPPGEWHDISLDPAGRIVLVGSIEGDLAVARLTPAGAPDPAFGNAGIARVHLGRSALEGLVTETLERSVALPDGSVLAAGWSTLCAEGCRSTSGVVIKLAPDGALDPTFGEGGFDLLQRAPRPEPGHGKGVVRRAFALAVQPDGKILVGGNDYRLLVVVRLTSTGAVDTSFGKRGAFFTDKETEGDEEESEEGAADLFHLGTATSILVEPSGEIVVTGDEAVFGVLPDGRLDLHFGGGPTDSKFAGEQTFDGNTSIGDALLDASGRIVVVGLLGNRPGIARFSAGGFWDRSFGRRGLMAPPAGNSPSISESAFSPPLSDVGLLPDGGLIAAGYGHFERGAPDSQLVVLRRPAG